MSKKELLDEFGRDQETQLSDANSLVENYMTIEFVAIPPDFDIMNYLSLREQANIFSLKHVNLKHLEIIADGVKSSPVFSMLNNIRIEPTTCLYFLKVIHELGLVLKTLHNPIRSNIDHVLQHLDKMGKSKYDEVFIRGQTAKRVNFTIINIFPMMNEEIIHEAMSIAQKLQEYQKEVDKKIESMDNI